MLRTPAFFSRVSTSSHERPSGPRHTSRIGSFLPSTPDLNGSGNAPTTAGTRIAASQSWWSNHTRSPG